ncbi:cupin domain-containing protein [Magnetospirillum moscoviense]|uniref:cupin domain-containing protein n=1 Tax=Magnetospirillum moscoviense TaxID=1437059 RepID=UPI00316AD359
MTRVFNSAAHVWPDHQAPERSLIFQSTDSAVAAWILLPGQSIASHRHPGGQDTWVVLEGEAEYLMGNGESCILRRGDIAVATAGQIHGAHNHGQVPFLFISLVAPAQAGFELADD